MSRDAFVLENHQVVIFWSRKAGNTSLCDWLAPLYRKGGEPREEGEFLGEGVSSRRLLKELGMQFTFDEVQPFLDRGFETFVLTRDPYRRIVSGYVDKYIFNSGRPMDSFERLVNNAKKTFLEAMAFHGRGDAAGAYFDDYPGISFRDLVFYVRHQLQNSPRKKRRNEPRINDHFNTQVPYAFEDFRYQHMMKLERIADDIAPLAQRLSHEMPFPHSRPMVRGLERVRGEGLSTASSLAFVKAKSLPHPDDLLDEVTRPIVREAFAIDFRKFGYPA